MPSANAPSDFSPSNKVVIACYYNTPQPHWHVDFASLVLHGLPSARDIDDTLHNLGLATPRLLSVLRISGHVARNRLSTSLLSALLCRSRE